MTLTIDQNQLTWLTDGLSQTNRLFTEIELIDASDYDACGYLVTVKTLISQLNWRMLMIILLFLYLYWMLNPENLDWNSSVELIWREVQFCPFFGQKLSVLANFLIFNLCRVFFLKNSALSVILFWQFYTRNCDSVTKKSTFSYKNRAKILIFS